MKYSKTAVLAAAAALMLILNGCAAGTDVQPNSVTVNGAGEVEVTPDIAVLKLGVKSEAADTEQVRSSNAAAVNAVIDAVKALGVEEKDIQTTDVNLRSSYDSNGKQDGYLMETTLEIIVRDMEKSGEVVDACIASGSNTMRGITYAVSNQQELYADALEAAVESAHQTAQAIAQAGGREVGEMLNATEMGEGMTVRPGYAGGNAAMDSAAQNGTSIQPGTDTIQAEVQVTYRLK